MIDVKTTLTSSRTARRGYAYAGRAGYPFEYMLNLLVAILKAKTITIDAEKAEFSL